MTARSFKFVVHGKEQPVKSHVRVDFEEETRSRLCEKGCRPGILARTRLRPHCAARGHSPRPAKR